MILLILILFVSNLFSQELSGDPIVLEVINKQTVICRNSNPRNCIKPILHKASQIKAIEIKILSAEQVSFTTYNKNAVPTDLEKNYSLKIMGDRENSLIDVDLEINALTSSDSYLKNACTNGDNAACSFLGKRLIDKNKDKQGLTLLKNTCSKGSFESCLALSDYSKLNKDETNLIFSLDQLCKLKNQESCNNLAINYINKNNGHALITVLIDQCKNGNSLSCLISSQIFIKENPKESVNSLKLGCDQINGQDICYLIGLIYYQINKPDEGKEYFSIACKRDFSAACLNDISKTLKNSFQESLQKRGIIQDIDFSLNPKITL